MGKARFARPQNMEDGRQKSGSAAEPTHERRTDGRNTPLSVGTWEMDRSPSRLGLPEPSASTGRRPFSRQHVSRLTRHRPRCAATWTSINLPLCPSVQEWVQWACQTPYRYRTGVDPRRESAILRVARSWNRWETGCLESFSSNGCRGRAGRSETAHTSGRATARFVFVAKATRRWDFSEAGQTGVCASLAITYCVAGGRPSRPAGTCRGQ